MFVLKNKLLKKGEEEMKRRDVQKFQPGTAAYVVAHASWKRRHGRAPSLPFAGIRDPRQALELARRCLANPLQLTHKGWWHELGRTKISEPTKSLLREAIRALRKGLEPPEISDQEFLTTIQEAGAVSINGEQFGLANTQGRLTLMAIHN